jgi:F-type H+-transporting ATPase subunit delta
MAERATIARPYAKAAFEYARAAGALAEWSHGLKLAAEIVADARVAALASNPRWSAAGLVDFITGIAGDRLDAAMRNFVAVLAENRRLLLLPEIAAHYQALRAQIENTVDVEVVSAVALDAAQAEQLRQALDTRLKRRVRMQHRVDPTLLGGALIRAGDLVIDASLKGRLERLGTELAR